MQARGLSVQAGCAVGASSLLVGASGLRGRCDGIDAVGASPLLVGARSVAVGAMELTRSVQARCSSVHLGGYRRGCSGSRAPNDAFVPETGRSGSGEKDALALLVYRESVEAPQATVHDLRVQRLIGEPTIGAKEPIMTRIVVLLASCAIVAGCSAMPTAPAASSTGATLGGPLALADPSVSGTGYTLIAIDSHSMTYVASGGQEFEAPYDSNTTFRRAQLDKYSPTDPCRAIAESYNSIGAISSDSYLAVLTSYASQQCNARIVAQLTNLLPGDPYQPGDPYVPPNPIRILSFQPIP